MGVDLKEFKADYDWRSALHMAMGCYDYGWYSVEPQPGPMDDVVHVLACDAGDNDGPEWIGVARFADGRWAMFRAGCGYCGWCCRAHGDISYFETVDAACGQLSLTPEERTRLCGQLAACQRAEQVRLDWDVNEPAALAEST